MSSARNTVTWKRAQKTNKDETNDWVNDTLWILQIIRHAVNLCPVSDYYGVQAAYWYTYKDFGVRVILYRTYIDSTVGLTPILSHIGACQELLGTAFKHTEKASLFSL